MTKRPHKLSGNTNDVGSLESSGLERQAPRSRERAGRREPPVELDWSSTEYIPLPPSPTSWLTRDRGEFHRVYDHPKTGPVIKAGIDGQYEEVVELAVGLSADQRKGRVGDVIVEAYRKLIVQRMKAGHLAAAAGQSVEMFDLVPGAVADVDRRRFNRILRQMNQAGKPHGYTPIDVPQPTSQPWFTVLDGARWTITGERRLRDHERPSQAFEVAAIDEWGTWMLDRRGSSADQSDVKSVLRRLDRLGQLVGEKYLYHNAYRASGGPTGANIAIMDTGGMLHIYDSALNLVMEWNLQEDPRVVDHFRTIDTNYWGEIKPQVRVVKIAPEGDRFLFTLADEAWCCTLAGGALWGVTMPLNEGWKRVTGNAESFGGDQEVEQALGLLRLHLPVTPKEIKRQYRALAMTHHPDRNPNNPGAGEKMKELNRAFQVLTGVDPNTLEFETSDITYFARTAADRVVDLGTFQMEFTIGGGRPQDWVYAASFAASDGCAYVATYSGKIVLLSREGQPLAVFDIGFFPQEITEIGRYTYFLTFTRLYVVEDRTKLAAIIDVFEQGRLLPYLSGFGLLTSRKLEWFTVSGVKAGELVTRDPIKMIHKTDGGAIVQTRQHQAEVGGPGL